MAYLEANAPYNSHVLFVGLVDGRVLWDIMNAETHRTCRKDRSKGGRARDQIKAGRREPKATEQRQAGAGTDPPPPTPTRHPIATPSPPPDRHP